MYCGVLRLQSEFYEHRRQNSRTGTTLDGKERGKHGEILSCELLLNCITVQMNHIYLAAELIHHFSLKKMNQRLLAHRSSHSSTLATISSTVYSRQCLRGNTYNQRYTPYNELHLHSYCDKYVRKKNKQYPVCSEESNKKKATFIL